MAYRNYSAQDTISSAMATLRPVPVYHTCRSGLAVELGRVCPGVKAEPHCGEPFVSVKIDGTVDYMDCEHLVRFFTELAKALKQ